MPPAKLTVLYEDNHLLAVSKPAMLPTMGVEAPRESLLDRARAYIKEKYAKPGNVYLGVVSRLDTPVTGLVLLARTSKAASRLSEAFRTRTVEKTYWALVEGVPSPLEGRLVDWLRKDERHRKMHIAEPDSPGAQQASLSYRLRRRLGGLSLIEISLETGRKHQIRVQFSHFGRPILGDRKYGGRLAFPEGIALHARRLELIHPVRKTPMELIAPIPATWRAYDVDEKTAF